ncbi:MAG: DUF2207 domain-containing protein [Planctomycetaceae bacterium]
MRLPLATRNAGGIRWIAAAVVACAVGSAAPAVARSIEIDDFLVDVAIDAQGGLDVTETIRLRFSGQWNGIIRTIPIQNVTSRGERRSLGFRLVSVTDEADHHLEVTKSRRGADMNLKIRVPGAADAVRTVVIRYRITGGLRFFDDHDELYWNVTGDEWTFPIRAARARITLPPNVVNVRANGFTGSHGSSERAVRIVVDGAARAPDDVVAPASESPPPEGGAHVIEIEATRPLGMREGLTAAVAWNPGVIRRPSAWAKLITAWSSWFAGRSLLAAVLGAPVLAFVGMFWRWWRVGRDPRPGPLVVQYGPPAGLGPAEVGTLIDNTPDNRDLMAGLVDAAVKGVVRIRETSPRGWFKRADYAFDLLRPEGAWVPSGISPSGFRMLRGMFKNEKGEPDAAGVIDTVASGQLAESFYKRLPGIKDAIFADLVGRGFYRQRPDATRTSYAVVAGVAGAAVWLLAAVVLPRAGYLDETMTLAVPLLLGATTALVIVFFAFFMPARTVAGAQARDHVRGFEEFLSRVDGHRLASLPLTPELFEKFLPYAIALGVERRWSRAFADICTQPPTWYVGSSPDSVFDTDGFTNQLGLMSASTSAAMTSAPRSSGDSGFGGGGGGGDWGGGGGGFSGGGDGGGGGSGW